MEEQLDFLQNACERFDAGREHEAKNIALRVRVLVHDSKRSTSLLTLIGVRNHLPFVDRGPLVPHPPPVITIAPGLCVIESEVGGDESNSRFVPAFPHDEDLRWHPAVSFQDWWERPVIDDLMGNTFNRRALILSMANQDGGAHIDAQIDQKYQQLSREGSLGFKLGNGEIGNGVVAPSVRQIGEELLSTIRRGVSWTEGEASVLGPICGLPLSSTGLPHENEACPCGSGRKLKNCFGRREPLMRATDRPRRRSREAGRRADSTKSRLLLDALILEPADP